MAVVAGIGVAVYLIAGVESSKAFFHNGNWIGSNNLALGENELVTAQVSTFALFALPSQEAVYLFARRDSNNELLHSQYDYTITGNINQLHARYWSITLYGKDLYLVANEGNRFSFNNQTIKTDTAGNFIIDVSRKGENWLPVPVDKRFDLVLRLYKGEHAFIDSLAAVPLPVIKRTII